jgi:hypothetical protein
VYAASAIAMSAPRAAATDALALHPFVFVVMAQSPNARG